MRAILRSVRLAGKTDDADADADLLGEKNTVISESYLVPEKIESIAKASNS